MATIDLPLPRDHTLCRAPSCPPPHRRRDKAARSYTRLNAGTARFLTLLVLLSAVPVASNRPAWWLIWTFVLGAVALTYILRAQTLMGSKRPFQIRSLRGFIALALLVPLYAIFQSMPWAAHIPAALQALPPNLTEAAIKLPDSLSVMPGASLLGAIRAVGFLLFLILVIEVGTNPARAHKIGLWLMLGILCHGLFGLISLRLLDDYAFWGDKDMYQGMLTGTFVNRNSMASFLGFGLVLGMAFAITRGQEVAQTEPDRGYKTYLTAKRLDILGFWCVTAVLALCIVQTQSRMGVVATGLGAFVTFIALRLTYKTSLTRILLQTGGCFLLLLIGLVAFAGAGVVERSLFAWVESGDRISLYTQTWGMILNRPLTGFGYDAFAPAFELYRDDPLVTDRYIDLAHNTYLALWAEQGFVIGSIPIILTGWATLIILRRLRAGSGDTAMNAAALGVIALGASHSLLDFSLEIPTNTYCVLLIIGLAMAPTRERTKTPHTVSGRTMTLLQRLLQHFSRPPSPKTAQITILHPFNGPVYAVGDVHGCLSLYSALETAILHDSQTLDRPPTIILLGDMIDRGAQSAQVIDHLMAPLPIPGRRLCLMGNHEAMMLRYLANPRDHGHWLDVGGAETLASYGLGIDVKTIGLRKLQHALSAHLPEHHLQFLRDLPPAIQVGAYLLAHAGADATAPLAAQPLRALVWGSAGRTPPQGLTLVHGHVVTDCVDCTRHSIGIDTGAYATGRLTALRLMDGFPPAVFTAPHDTTFHPLAPSASLH